MKLFLGIDLPFSVKQNINEQLTGFIKEYPQFEWVSFENYYIAIHYFGDVFDEKNICQKLKDLLYDQQSFYLYSLNAEMFTQHKITMYFNFKREKHLEEIAKRVQEKYSFPQRKVERYIPHLTFARFRIPSKQQYFVMKKKLNKLKIDFSFQVKKLILFESVLGKKTTRQVAGWFL